MTARAALRLLVAAGSAAGFVALGGATPALAAAGSSVTASASGRSIDGQTLTSDATIAVKGHGTTLGQNYTLQVVDPNGNQASDSQRAGLTGASNTEVDVDTTSWRGGEAPNGEWRATLTGGGQTSFTLAIPPAPVSGFTASGDASQVTLSWTANTEPDLVGYVVTLPNGSTQPVTPGTAGCSVDPHCSVSYQPAAGDAGKTLQFQIAAERNGACGCSASPIAGSPSDASMSMPSPSPTATSSGRGSSAGSGGSGGPSSAGDGSGGGSFLTGSHGGASHDRVGRNGFTSGGKLQAFVPRTQAKLPVPNLSSVGGPNVVLPGGEGASAVRQSGGYRPTLAYPPGHGGAPSGAVATGRSTTSSFLQVVNRSAVWRSLGLAAILLLGATHLLLWLRRTPAEL